MKITDIDYASPKECTINLVSLIVCQVKPNHIHEMILGDYTRIVYIEEGSADFVLADKTIRAKCRDIVYLPPGCRYTSYWDSEVSSQFFVLDIRITKENAGVIHFGDEPCALLSDTAKVYSGYYREIKALPDNTPLAWLERNILAMNLFREIAREVSTIELGRKYRQIYKGIIYIETNYTKNFSVKEVADMCFMSTGHFRKMFKQYKNTSPIQYRNGLRIRRATELLKSGLYSVAQAGEAVGFDDIKYFSKLYKAYTGISPKTQI